jgi:hypothetical protein
MNTITPGSVRTAALASNPPSGQQPKPDEQHGPDLIVDRLDPSNSFPWPGDMVNFSVRVTNKGDQPAAAFDVRVTTDGVDQTQRVKDGLQPGQSVKLKGFGPLDTNGFQTMYWVQASADSSNEVAETREDNNEMWTTVSVQQPPQPPPIPPPPPFPHPPHPVSNPTTLLAE